MYFWKCVGKLICKPYVVSGTTEFSTWFGVMAFCEPLLLLGKIDQGLDVVATLENRDKDQTDQRNIFDYKECCSPNREKDFYSFTFSFHGKYLLLLKILFNEKNMSSFKQMFCWLANMLVIGKKRQYWVCFVIPKLLKHYFNSHFYI